MVKDDDKQSKHILVINDTEDIVELFGEIITNMGHRMSATGYAPEDLADIIKVEPDLVIVDIIIDGETEGWQLIQKMRMSTKTQDIPIIVCSAATEDVREQEGWLLRNGIKVVLKPFTVPDLELAITKALDLPKQRA